MDARSAAISRSAPLRLCGWVGRGAFGWLGNAGRMAIFFRDAATRVHRRPFRLLELITQLEFVGARSVTVVALSAAAPPPGR